MPQTIDQKCAESAYKAYTELKKDPKKKEIFGYAKKMPMMIINSGLGNAIMFKYNKDNHNRFHEYFLEWLTGIKPEKERPGEKIMGEILKDSISLRYYTAKALRWLEWFNRFADTEEDEIPQE